MPLASQPALPRLVEEESGRAADIQQRAWSSMPPQGVEPLPRVDAVQLFVLDVVEIARRAELVARRRRREVLVGVNAFELLGVWHACAEDEPHDGQRTTSNPSFVNARVAFTPSSVRQALHVVTVALTG